MTTTPTTVHVVSGERRTLGDLVVDTGGMPMYLTARRARSMRDDLSMALDLVTPPSFEGVRCVCGERASVGPDASTAERAAFDRFVRTHAACRGI